MTASYPHPDAVRPRCALTARGLAAIATLLFSTTLLAQTAPAPATPASEADKTVVMDQFVVSDYRSSLAASLDAKRKATAIVDVITAEDVGKFPDTNVAESLSHIPGLTVDRLFGQGERVSILGTDPALNRTLLNGQTIASADWFILDIPGRTFNYSLLAPEIIGRAEVYRTPEARIDEGSIGGTILLHTRDPLSLKSGAFNGSVGMLYNDRSKKDTPTGSAMYSWKNEAGTFGVVASAQYFKEHIRRDGIESYGYVTAKDYTDAGSKNAVLLANPTAQGPNAIGTAYFNQERIRKGGTLSAVFKPDAHFDFTVNALYVKADYNNINQSLYTFPGRTWDATSIASIDNVSVANGVITKLHDGKPAGVLDVQYREATVKTHSVDAKAAWHNQPFDFSIHGGTTRATGGTQRQLFGEFLNWTGYSYDISGAPGSPGSVTWDDPNVPKTASAWVTDAGWGGNLAAEPTLDRESYGQADAEYALNAGMVRKLRFGAKYRDHETSRNFYAYALVGVAWPASMFASELTPGNFLNGLSGVNDQMKRRVTVDGNAMAAAIANAKPENGVRADFWDSIWNIKEKTTNAYLQADFGQDALSGNIGVRFANTKDNAGGYTVNAGTGAATAVTASRSYNNFLPSLNLAYEVQRDLITRIGIAEVIARPNYSDLTPYVSLNDTVHTGSGGNTNLDPYKSYNFDIAGEWYFAKNSVATAGVFYKDISNYILTSTFNEQHFDITTKTANVNYLVSRPGNGGKAKSKGFTLAYQHTFSSGFGLLANYAYIDASTEAGVELPFTSKNQFNLTPFYENQKFSVRATYAWRSKYFTGIDRGTRQTTDAYKEVDASIGYNINKQFQVTIDGLNLLDEDYYSYADSPSKPRGAYKTGRRYQAALHFTF